MFRHYGNRKKKTWSFAYIMKACPETNSVLEHIQAETCLADFPGSIHTRNNSVENAE